MTPALLLLGAALVLALGAALAYAVRLDDRLDRELRTLDRVACSPDCTACSSAPYRAKNGDHRS
ncbi:MULTISPECIES: hypothetical protein [unclassified Streptomyces]|uniref:hypothetical protein n=1 Tax=unclassified Streptomyces TaxID=2593676 RepID=UPI0006AEF518|nr:MULTISPECIES: hypothetical protein [unclassified Streptomyces]KOX16564.1 hypothetical protein ADL06_33195 [Streptomyces sp. NRRL F-6491]KOX36108.1 hypothetical protein ADL08_33545 [Streptomyces sp. NRRL F-6492]